MGEVTRFTRTWAGFKGARLSKLAIIAATVLMAPVPATVLVTDRFFNTDPTSGLQAPIHVADGDTVRSGGYAYWLVGFDTPKAGSLARCERERTLAAAATRRLEQLITGGNATLQRVACSCPAGTEETRACNHGRRCGVLKIANRDVGSILISEGLARPQVCGETSCPRRQSWCDSISPEM
jgi:endonuclease YncB( thermonuclease family)